MDLNNAGLGHYSRKLCDDLGLSTLKQVLTLDRVSLDALIDSLRPLPGHRVRLLDFFEKERAKLEERGAPGVEDSVPRTQAATSGATSVEEQRNFRVTMASLGSARRGKDGPISHLQQQQPHQQWGAKGDSRAHATVSRVRVVKVAGGGRVVEYDGPRPNAPTRTSK